MGHVIEKATGRFRGSVSVSKFSAATHLINPDVSAVATQAPTGHWQPTVEGKYFVRDGGATGDVVDPVTEMDAGQKATVDAAEATADTNANRAEAIEVQEGTGRPDSILIRGDENDYNKRINWLTNRVVQLQNTVAAMLVTISSCNSKTSSLLRS